MLDSDFANRLRKNWAHLRKWARREGTTAFRVFDADIPEWRYAVDWYAGRVQIAEKPSRNWTAEETAQRREHVLAAVMEVLGVPGEHVVLKTREPKAWRSEQYLKLGDEGQRIVVEEHGLRFIVNLTDHIDTGLFLDHRETRRLVRKEAKGRSFLNLFCYTGAFTVHAAAGGASSTTSVDLSNTYLDWARENLELNGFTGQQHELIRSDVTRWLHQVRGRSWDLIVLDPPPYSVSAKMEASFEIERDHVALIQATLVHLARGGALYFSTNYRGFSLDAAAFEGCRETRELSPGSIPPDFHDRRIHRCWRVVR